MIFHITCILLTSAPIKFGLPCKLLSPISASIPIPRGEERR